MLLGALLDLGASRARLEFLERFEGLGVTGTEIRIAKTVKQGLSATCVDVLPKEHYHARSGEELRALLNAAATFVDASEEVRRRAGAALELLLSVEAQVHGSDPESVHLHEAGSFDTIVDMLGFFLLLEDLGFPPLCSLPVRVGGGTVRTAHGLLAVPVPAVAALAARCAVPLEGGPVRKEIATPTGVALLASSGARFLQDLPSVVPLRVGYGAGRKDFSVPNVLRALLCRGDAEGEEEGGSLEEVLLFEVSIDDMTGEEMGRVLALLQEVALESHLVQALGKKGRPLFLLRVLAKRENFDSVADLLFGETSTIGFRYWPVGRRKMRYTVERRPLKKGEERFVRVKISRFGDVTKEKVEFEDRFDSSRKNDLGHLQGRSSGQVKEENGEECEGI
jgi:uncharacterized protein (TIGR00299 family) protein